MGKYDVPAILEFILTKTGRDKLIYIGHSMGCSMFFVAMSTFPQLGSKIELMVALAPAVSLGGMASPIMRAVAPFVKQVEVSFKKQQQQQKTCSSLAHSLFFVLYRFV